MERIDECLRIALHLDGPLPFAPDAEEFKAPQADYVAVQIELIKAETERDLYKELYMKHTGLM